MHTEYTQMALELGLALHRMLHGRRESVHILLLAISFTFFEKPPKMYTRYTQTAPQGDVALHRMLHGR